MQRTSHGQDAGSPLISVFGGYRKVLVNEAEKLREAR
jgi:hypothetical protein